MHAEGFATDGSLLIPLSLVLAVLPFIYCASAAWSRANRLGNYPVVRLITAGYSRAVSPQPGFVYVRNSASVLQQSSLGGSMTITQKVSRKARFQMIAFMIEMKRQGQKKSADIQSYDYLK